LNEIVFLELVRQKMLKFLIKSRNFAGWQNFLAKQLVVGSISCNVENFHHPAAEASFYDRSSHPGVRFVPLGVNLAPEGENTLFSLEE
jgi:hypothetical protein